jgi:hypothetical protein
MRRADGSSDEALELMARRGRIYTVMRAAALDPHKSAGVGESLQSCAADRHGTLHMCLGRDDNAELRQALRRRCDRCHETPAVALHTSVTDGCPPVG